MDSTAAPKMTGLSGAKNVMTSTVKEYAAIAGVVIILLIILVIYLWYQCNEKSKMSEHMRNIAHNTNFMNGGNNPQGHRSVLESGLATPSTDDAPFSTQSVPDASGILSVTTPDGNSFYPGAPSGATSEPFSTQPFVSDGVTPLSRVDSVMSCVDVSSVPMPQGLAPPMTDGARAEMEMAKLQMTGTNSTGMH